MAKYQQPGVYVTEVDALPLARGLPTGVPCFFGFTDRGPSGPPIRIDSLNQYYSVFGKKPDPTVFPNQNLTDAVHGFFLNGGSTSYVCRINQGVTATWPVQSLQDVVDYEAVCDEEQPDVTLATPTFAKFLVRAISPGAWANRLVIHCEKVAGPGLPPASAAQLPPGMSLQFALTVKQIVPGQAPGEPPSEQVVEQFLALSTNPDAPDYFLRDEVVNGTSSFIRLAKLDTSVAQTEPQKGSDKQPLATDYSKFFELLRGSPDVSIIACPDAYPEAHATPELTYQTIYQSAITYAEAHHCMVVIDPPPVAPDQVKSDSAAMSEQANKLSQFADQYRSPNVAIYAPWVTTANLDPTDDCRTKLVPPSGLIVGAYNTTDDTEGVWKAPANIPLRGAVELQYAFTEEQSQILNPAGVNAIRTFPGNGILIWGARTTSTDPTWRYVNVRRLCLYVERTLKQQLMVALFEPNIARTWAMITQSIGTFLYGLWQAGGLMGTTQNEAFRVQCGIPQTMTMQDVEAGLLKVEVAIAPTRPAEFIVLTISQLVQTAAPDT